MGCDKTANLPDPTSVHAVDDDLSLSIRQSEAADYNSVIQGGFSSGANVTSFPFVSSQGGFSSGANVTSFPFVSSQGGFSSGANDTSFPFVSSQGGFSSGANATPFPFVSYDGEFSSGANATSFPFVSSPAVRPLPGNFNEMNNFEMVDLMNLNTLHHHHLEPNLMNVRNISSSFSSPSEMPHSAKTNHSNMNNNMPTSDSLMSEGVLSKGIQNLGASMNFMPMQSSGAGCFEKVGKATGISQNSFQASGSPFGIGYNMQNTKSIVGTGVHKDAKVNPVPFPSAGDIDGSFLTLGIGSNIKDRSNLRFSGKEVSSKLEEAVLPQSNKSPVQQMRGNFPSVIHGVSGGITNFQHDMGGLPNSAMNSGVLAPGSRISAPPFMYATPDARLNSSNTRNSGAVGKADLRLSEPDPLKYSQGGLPSPPFPFSSNSTLPPHLGFGRMAAAPESAHPVRVAAQSTINLQNNLYANISRNQSFMGSPILTHGGGGRVRQDHLGQQSFVNVPHPWGNNLYLEGMGAQIAGWSGIQPAPGNQFPKRLGVQLNDGAISQATREGVLPGTVGIQQIGRGNSYQSQDHGPKMQPTELSHPPFAMGRPQGGSPAKFNVSGFPYHAGQGISISKADGTPQASYIHGHTSLKRRASRAPPTPPTCQRRRTLTQHSNQQLIAQQRQITNSPVPASSPSLPSSLVKQQGLEEPPQPVGVKCHLCKRDVAFNPEGPISRPAAPPPVAVLPCGHVFHDHCLELITPKDQSKEPPCIPCALGET